MIIKHKKLEEWISQMVELCQPDEVIWIDGWVFFVYILELICFPLVIFTESIFGLVLFILASSPRVFTASMFMNGSWVG